MFPSFIFAKIIGMPPYKVINIPKTIESGHFDMVQDNNNVIYVAYQGGIKIYNGSQWQIVKIPVPRDIRILYYDNDKRIYFGGWNTKGYIEQDQFGQYQYTIIKPDENSKDIDDFWFIDKCNNKIYFQSIHNVFGFDPINQKTESWYFKSKISAMICTNNHLLIQDRKKGLFELQEDGWQKSEIELENNALIYKFGKTDSNVLFTLSDSDDWRIIKDKKVIHLDFSNQLPNLDNYVSVTPLSNEKFVLGTNNGLVTFIDTINEIAESFQVTNDWVSKIVKTNDGGLLILTEFEIYYLEWPSPLRIQGKESGLASDIYDISRWNDKLYISSSAGVFLEEKNQMIYQHQLFKRLNWTNKEAWSFLPIDNTHALLAESHKILLINKDNSTTAISDVIYPRKLIKSQFHPNSFFVLTEFDMHLLKKLEDNSWQLNKISEFRSVSVIELNASTLLIGSEEDGLKKVILNSKNLQLIEEIDVSTEYGLVSAESNKLKFIKTNSEIHAYNNQGLYKLQNNQFEKSDIQGLDNILNKEEIIVLKQGQNGLLFGHTYSKLLYQTDDKSWQSIDLGTYMRGKIIAIERTDDVIKLSSNGMLITYLMNQPSYLKTPKFELIITSVNFEGEQSKQNLALNTPQIFNYLQGSGTISFAYVLTDIKNQDKVQYRYRLLGNDDPWQSYVDKTHVSFNHLPAGEYSFEVQARDHLNNVYTSKVYRFIVKPHWYLTMYAIILWGLITFLAIYLLLLQFVKWRERIHEAQKMELKKVIFKKTIELKKLNFSLQKMAHQDGLTGLSNRLYLDEYIEGLLTKDIKKITVIMMDMDHFKKYNDKNGHVAGDELLKELAIHLKKHMETEGNIVARYGGEEFVAILIGCHLDNVIEKSEAIRKSIENHQKHTSISIGISESISHTNLKNSDDIYHLIDQADKALYQAKDEGRNRICIYTK